MDGSLHPTTPDVGSTVVIAMLSVLMTLKGVRSLRWRHGKKLTDRYGGPMPTKGGFIYWKPKVIVVTSNSTPREWWPDASDFDIGAVERRIKEITVVE